MGSVYLAFDPNLRRAVAIKTIRTHLRRTAKDSVPFKDRFFREAQANSQLNHPGVINVYDSGIHNGEPFLVMEYVDGATLEDILNGDLIREPMLRYRLMNDIAAGLDYAHGQAVIHRDIKPTNVLVTRDGHAKIVDFGMAKLKDSNLTTTGVFLGTPSYASPEQILHGRIDHRADLFSFGIMAYEILTGERPFPGENINSILYHIVHTPPEFNFEKLELEEGLCQAVEKVFRRMLAKEPEQRYASAGDFMRDLEAALAMSGIREWTPADPENLLAWSQLPAYDEEQIGPSLDETMLLEDPMASRISNPMPLLMGIGGAILVLVVLILALPRTTAEPLSEGVAQRPEVDAVQYIANPDRDLLEAENEALVAERLTERLALEQQFQDFIDVNDLTGARETLDDMRTANFTEGLATKEKLLAAKEKEVKEAARQRNKTNVQNRFRAARNNNNVSGMRRALAEFKQGWPKDRVVIEAWEAALAEENAELEQLIHQDRRAFEQAMQDRDIETAELQLYRLRRAGVDVGADETRLANLKASTYTNDLGMRFILLPAGTFRMGPQSKPGSKPPHEVTLTQAFFMGVHEVTQAQWQAVMGENPSRVKGEQYPVHDISWLDAKTFVNKLNARTQDDMRYRLPTEAEWEYACRAGTNKIYGVGETLGAEDANFRAKGMDNPIPVGSYPPNPWGLFDMNGNVAEWVQDLHLTEWHRQSTNPIVDNETSTGYRIHRGGSYDSDRDDCACGERSRRSARSASAELGLRIVAERFED